ncbi:MAG: GAF domain-containing protein, partial [Chloroflexota bacterium]
YEALKKQGYQTHLFRDEENARGHLAKTDVLLLDATAAHYLKSNEFIKAPLVLVFTENDDDQLPSWLTADHVHLLTYPPNSQRLIHYIKRYMTPGSMPEPLIDPANIEHVAILFGITQALSGHLDIQELFECILALAPALGGDFASLLVQEGDETIYYRSTLPGCEELTGPVGRRFAQRLLEHGLEGWVLRHNQAVILPNTLHDRRWFRASYLPAEEQGVVALPISLDRIEAKGVYMIGHEQPGHFTPADVPLLQAAATQIGLAIENAILFKNQSARSVQLSLINIVSQAATSILNLDVMLRTVVEAIRRSFAFYSVSIHLYDPAARAVELRARVASDHLGPISRAERTVHKLREGLIGWTAATNKTIIANDVTQDPRYIPSHESKEIRAEVCVPIKLGVKTIGVLNLKSTQLGVFDKHHVSALETLADQLAIAIENARLYDEINQRVNELKTLNEIGLAITSTLDLRETLTLITDLTTRLMNVAAASVALRKDETNEIWFAAAFGEGSEAVIGMRM